MALVSSLRSRTRRIVPASAFISCRGQLTKRALEHVLPAYTLEELAVGSWEAAIDNLIRDLPEAPSELPDGDA